jgi:hypothetical protein
MASGAGAAFAATGRTFVWTPSSSLPFLAGGGAEASPSSIRPTTAPMVTVFPSGTVVTNLPEAGAATSVVAFSVSNSKTGSSARTFSPFFFSQRESTPSVMDSPTEGTLISTDMIRPLSVRHLAGAVNDRCH